MTTVLFTGDVDIFLLVGISSRRKIGGIGRVLVFPSEALLAEVYFSLDAGLGGGLSSGVVLVGRRKDAEGDRDTGVKVQVDRFLPVREILFSNILSTRRKEDKKGSLASVF